MTKTPSPATPSGAAGLPAADPRRLTSLVDLGLTNAADPTIRLTAWDQPEALPSSQITSLEQACAVLDVDAHGSAVLLRTDGFTDRVGRNPDEQIAAPWDRWPASRPAVHRP